MPRSERIREAVTSLANPNYLIERASAGWRLTALEWEREIPEALEESRQWSEDLPYGLQVSADSSRLVENPSETKIVILALDMIVEDCPLSKVSAEMTRRGYRMRDGQPWTPAALFALLPRMIQMGPRLFSSEEWMTRKLRLPRAV